MHPPARVTAPPADHPATLQSLFRLLLPDVPTPTPPLLTTSEAQLLLSLLHSPSSTNPHQLAALALAELCHLSRPTASKALELDGHLAACFGDVVDEWIRAGSEVDRCKAVGFATKLVDVVPSAAIRILARPALLFDLFTAASAWGPASEPSSSTAPYVPPSAALPLALTILLGRLIGFKDGIALLLQSDVDVPRWLEEQYQNASGNLELRAKAAGVRVRLGRELLATVGEDTDGEGEAGEQLDDFDGSVTFDDDDDDATISLDGEEDGARLTVGRYGSPAVGSPSEQGELTGQMASVSLAAAAASLSPSPGLAALPLPARPSSREPHPLPMRPAAFQLDEAEHMGDVSMVSVAPQINWDQDGAESEGGTPMPATPGKKRRKKKKKSKAAKANGGGGDSGSQNRSASQPAASDEPPAIDISAMTVSDAAAALAAAGHAPSEADGEALAQASAHVDVLLSEWLVFATQKRAGRTVLSIAQGVAILDKHRSLPPGSSAFLGAFFGLAALSVRHAVKDLLAANVQFLGCLFNLVCSCSDRDVGLLVAMCQILHNLVAFRPSVQQGLECPARDPPELTADGGEDDDYQVELMTYFWRQDSAVIRRAERLVSASIISILVRVSQQYGAEVAQVIGPTIRALAEIEGAREELRKEGGPLAALWMMSQMLPAAPKSGRQDQVLGSLEGALLQTLHGLALMVTGATKEELESTISPVEDLVAPICLLLFTDRDILPGLLKADALAALKSLTCCGPDVTDEIASFHGYELMRFLERLLVGQDYYLSREANALIYCLFHSQSPAAFRYLELPTDIGPAAALDDPVDASNAAAGLPSTATAKSQGKRPARLAPAGGAFARGWKLLNLLLVTAATSANELSIRLCASATQTDIITAHPTEACQMLLDHPVDAVQQRDDALRYLLALFKPQQVNSAGRIENRVHAGLVDRGAFILLNTVHSCSAVDPDLLQTLKRLDARAALHGSVGSVRSIRAGALEQDLGRPNGEDLRRELLGKLKLVMALLEGRSLEDIQWRVLGA